MIERYSLPKMRKLWQDSNKFNMMLKVELSVVKAYANFELIPDSDYLAIKEKARVDVKRIQELEEETKHDVIAFTSTIEEKLGKEKKWFHFGLTSTDVVDTAQSLILKNANDIIDEDIKALLEVLKNQALKYQKTPCIGRTHGMHAEVTSFGLKWLGWYDELTRAYTRFTEERAYVEVAKISGPVGNYADIDPRIEEFVASDLKLNAVSMATQVISRDRHIGYLNSIAMIASLIEKIATEIRHLSRSEVAEVCEYFAKGQKGSSSMPHKKNPIASENMCGCARVMRSYLEVAYNDNPLWHERDISHSSCERIILPDATQLIDYMLTRYTKVLDTLVVDEAKMMKNIKLTKGIIYSSQLLLKLVQKGLSRDSAYILLQQLAFQSIEEKRDYADCIQNSQIGKIITTDELKQCLDWKNSLRNISYIYKKILGE